jgi:hypothetical protein
MPTHPDPEFDPAPDLRAARRTLHALAELLMAGPQHRASGTIRLRVRSGGFATVADPPVRLEGVHLIGPSGRAAVLGCTATELADAVGVTAGAPEGVYADTSGVGVNDALTGTALALSRLEDALQLGDLALRTFAPDTEPVLWPEHFDVGIRLDEINYGVSPSDGHLSEPYAYVGVDPVPADDFFAAPFGATRTLNRCGDVAGVVAFFAEGRRRATGGAQPAPPEAPD